MSLGALYCETPGQSLLVALLAGLLGGVAGVAVGLGAAGVVALAAGLAVVGELAGHLLRGDDQFRRAVRQVRGDG